MEQINQRIRGVLNATNSEANYALRRYPPSDNLRGLIEQIWLVDWQLNAGKTHEQKNLPDPNLHVVISPSSMKLLGPVSRVFSYTMAETGMLIGIKFRLAALDLPKPIGFYVDKEENASKLFDCLCGDFHSSILRQTSDEKIVDMINTAFATYRYQTTPDQAMINDLIATLKHNADIFSVDALAAQAAMPVRKIQRLFKQYVGLTPKSLIRRYRLHELIDNLEQQDIDIHALVEKLKYTDQSHLLRDFKALIGQSLGDYRK